MSRRYLPVLSLALVTILALTAVLLTGEGMNNCPDSGSLLRVLDVGRLCGEVAPAPRGDPAIGGFQGPTESPREQVDPRGPQGSPNSADPIMDTMPLELHASTSPSRLITPPANAYPSPLIPTLAPPSASLPVLRLSPVVYKSEGDLGTTTFLFTATLSAKYASDITFQVAIAPGTADPADYQAPPPTATIPAGQTLITIAVNVNANLTPQDDRYFFLVIRGYANIAAGGGIHLLPGRCRAEPEVVRDLGGAKAMGVIVDDDGYTCP